MEYLQIPESITCAEIRANNFSLLPSMFERVNIPNTNTHTIRELLDPTNPFDKGIEPGSSWYLPHSTHFFIRTKALQDHSSLLYPKGDAIIPINPRIFNNPNLSDDIYLSDSPDLFPQSFFEVVFQF